MILENKSADIAKDIAVNALRFALALVFAFSGFVKAIDPMGTVYKLTEYADAFGLPAYPALLLPIAWGLIAVDTQSFSDFTEQLWLSLDLRVPRQAELEEGKDLPVKSHLLGQDFTFSRFQHGNT